MTRRGSHRSTANNNFSRSYATTVTGIRDFRLSSLGHHHINVRQHNLLASYDSGSTSGTQPSLAPLVHVPPHSVHCHQFRWQAFGSPLCGGLVPFWYQCLPHTVTSSLLPPPSISSRFFHSPSQHNIFHPCSSFTPISKMVAPSRSPNQSHCCFHRYLKPGALARLRDSRIGAARSLQPKKSLPPSSIPNSNLEAPIQSAADDDDDIPRLLAKLYRPQSLNRKRLVAARSVLFAGLPSPSNPALDLTNRGDGGISHSNSNNGSTMAALNSDAVVVAH